MADRTMFFDELLRMPNLRAKRYVVRATGEPTCVELSARRLEDWFYARKWITTPGSRRLLYWVLDEVEAHGFRFQVDAVRAAPERPAPADESWERATVAFGQLSADEQRLHRELFPDEARLLSRGYDWDGTDVFRHGAALGRDAYGRVLDEDEGVVHEWVRIPEEWTWRRYPLFALRPARPAAWAGSGAAEAEPTAGT